jgi:hypothetical protein
MYTFKSIARRGTLLAAAAALAVATVLPTQAVFADALNPLTERSLSLSSGSPGWSYKDASGNGTYAPPNSGANGRYTGNTFGFRVSSTATVKGFSFQYCTTSAGNCKGPGNIPVTGSAGSYARDTNNDTQVAAQKSDLEVVTSSPSEVSTFGSKFSSTTGTPTNAANIPNRDNSEGNFIVLHKTNSGDPWVQTTGWAMAASVNQTVNGSAGAVVDDTSTGKNNYITLTKSGGVSLAAGDYVKIIFFGTDTNYMINPGAGAFFAKLNTYNSDTTLTEANVIDGGVTVANVMNRSIEIQTKVLETMDFSVGVVDPNTLDSTDTDAGTPGVQSQLKTANGRDAHATCDAVLPGMDQNTSTPNILQMGNADGEFSLETAHTYSTHSYWRLSSNSSAGATVYYSGVTLSNTVGDQIDPIGTTASAPTVGAEQFGLALANGTGPDYKVTYDQERDSGLLFENGVDNDIESIHTASLSANNVLTNLSWHEPQLAPLIPMPNYGNGSGKINTEYADDLTADGTAFAFDPNSTVIPVPIASENDDVVDCVTGKVRYIANIAATTPAGIYATKVNWIAAPQY